MSRLITSGDTLSNFGKYLPAPYIDKIYIEDGETLSEGSAGGNAAKITVDVFVYLRVTEDTDVDSLESELAGLPIYVLFANNLSSTTLEEIFAGKQYMAASSLKTDGGRAGWYFSSMTRFDEEQFDDNGNKIIKYYYTTTIESTTAVWGSINSSYVFAWTHTEEWEEEAWWTTWPPSLYTMISLEQGEISYEVVMENGVLATQEEVIWVDDQGGFYDGTALQALSSKYYKSDKITHSEIVDSFQSLLDEYETSAKTDSALQNIIDQISYILTTSGKSADLLTQLNLLRRAFPSKSSATSPGELYLKYREKIYTANAVVETDSILSKKIISNSKIIDNRTSENEYDHSDDRGSRGGTELLPTTMLFREFTGNALQGMSMGGDTPAADSYEFNYLLINRGLALIDYTATVCQYSAIGNYIDLPAYLALFPASSLYQHVTPTKITLTVEDQITMTQAFEDYETQPWLATKNTFTTEEGSTMSALSYYYSDPTYAYTNVVGVDFDGDAVEYDLSAYTSEYEAAYGTHDPEIAYSYVSARNFVPYVTSSAATFDTWAGDYRLLGIEYQILEDVGTEYNGVAAGGIPDEAWAKREVDDDFTIRMDYSDTTESLLIDLIAAYKNALVGLEAYVEVAQEYSAYNAVDGTWNEYFSTLMHNTYDGTPGSAPWEFYPVYYNTHLELLTKKFGGDIDQLIADAADISTRISPDTGNMEQLEAFVSDFSAIANDIYSEDDDTFGKFAAADATAPETTIYTTNTWDYGSSVMQDMRLVGELMLGAADIGAGLTEEEYDSLINSDTMNPYISAWALNVQPNSDTEAEIELAALLELAQSVTDCTGAAAKPYQLKYFEALYEYRESLADGRGQTVFTDGTFASETEGMQCIDCKDISAKYIKDSFYYNSTEFDEVSGTGFVQDEDSGLCEWYCPACTTRGHSVRDDEAGLVDVSPVTYEDISYSALCMNIASKETDYDSVTTLTGEQYTLPNGTNIHEFWKYCCIGLGFQDNGDSERASHSALIGGHDEPTEETCFDLYAATDADNTWYTWLFGGDDDADEDEMGDPDEDGGDGSPGSASSVDYDPSP